jgi:glycosyltransferase involved in cell wall biosynthesis
MIDISIVIPLYNEEESLPELVAWIHKSLEGSVKAFEIILADDGSRDKSWEVIKSLSEKYNTVKGISFRRNYGKSAALSEGFKLAEGNVVITMDADLQDSPEEILPLYKMIMEDGFELVSGWKKKRYDPITKTIPTKLFNGVTAWMSDIKLHDFNCGLKAYKKDVIKTIEVYGEMHRYIPVIAKKAGFSKIGEKVVHHQERKYGTTKFGLERFVNGFLDLLSILFVTRFGKRPMHLFGTIGTFSFLFGGAVTVWLIAEKLYKISTGIKPRDVVDQPLFYLALVSIIVGVQLFLAGFLGELITRNSSERNNYLIKETIR